MCARMLRQLALSVVLVIVAGVRPADGGASIGGCSRKAAGKAGKSLNAARLINSSCAHPKATNHMATFTNNSQRGLCRLYFRARRPSCDAAARSKLYSFFVLRGEPKFSCSRDAS